MKLSVITRVLNCFRYSRATQRFYVLDSEPNVVKSEISLVIKRFTTCSEDLRRVLRTIKCGDVNWNQRFQLGHICYVATSNAEPASYVWASPREWLVRVNERGPLADDVVFVYDAITVERFRGKRAFPATLAYSIIDLRRQGYLRNCTLIDGTNIAAQRCFAKLGYLRTDNTIRIYKLGRLLRYRTRSEGPPQSLVS